MVRKTLRPTDAELSILRALWRRGPSTVREVQDELTRPEAEGRHSGYTTVLKMLQIMTEKGLVERDASSRAHVYKPHDSQEHTQQHLVGDLMDRAFEGSTSRLLMQALAARPADAAEKAEIRRLLDAQDVDASDVDASEGEDDA